MKITSIQKSITEISADIIVVNLFSGVRYPAGATGAVDKALNNLISQMIHDEKITGKDGETVILTTDKIKSPRVLVAGLGSGQRFTLDTVVETARLAMTEAITAGCASLATIVHGGGIGGLDYAEAVKAVVRGSVYGATGRPGLRLILAEVSANRYEIMAHAIREIVAELKTYDIEYCV